MEAKEAKDTVLTRNQVNEMLKELGGGEIPPWVKWGEAHPDYGLCLKQAEATWPIAYQAGIREVVDWVESHKLYAGNVSIPAKIWQAQLKKWGVEKFPHAACGED